MLLRGSINPHAYAKPPPGYHLQARPAQQARCSRAHCSAAGSYSPASQNLKQLHLIAVIGESNVRIQGKQSPAAQALCNPAQKAAFCVWAVLCLVLTLRALSQTTLEQYEAFHIYYQPLICIVAMLWLWAGNVRYFEWRNLRYDLCFSATDQRFLLSSRQIFQVSRLHRRQQQPSTAGLRSLLLLWNLAVNGAA